MPKRKEDVSILSEVAVGQRSLVELHVGSLPSGTPIRIRAHIVRAQAPGPVALLLGGVHGDEINGIEIVRRAVCGDLADRLTSGTIIAIPLLNVFGFLNYSRDVPDGKDVNRSFPGSARGSLASRVAHALTKKVLPAVTFGLDFHTGGRSHFNYPQTRHTVGDVASAKLAEDFAAPVSLATKTISKSLRRTANTMGIPMVVYEGGENMRLDEYAVQVALTGTERVLHQHGMLAAATDHTPVDHDIMQMLRLSQHSWLRAQQSGLFDWIVGSGSHVKKGQKIGYLRDPFGLKETVIISPRNAFIIGHDNSPVISQGDALFHLAW